VDKRAVVVLALIFGGLFVALFGFLFLAYLAVQGAPQGRHVGPFARGGRIGVVEILGRIEESSDAVKQLHEFGVDDRIPAVVVRVDSPGGGVGPSQEIHAEVRRLAGKKPVVVSMGGLAASGGYYLAVPATRIVANPGTVTGSIGVITQVPNITELADKIGVDMHTVKSGPAKDLGNPFRPFSEEDRAVYQGLIDDVYDQFVRAVAEGRELPEEKVRAVADGRILTGEQALELGLVDELGNFRDAVRIAAELGGVEGEPVLVYPPEEEPFPLREFLSGSVREAIRAGVDELKGELSGRNSGAAVQYLLPGNAR
jgi:protease-4